MMNGKHLFSAVVAAGLVGFMSLAAVGVETLTLTEMQEVTANRTYTTNTYITGSGGFELKNNAYLTFDPKPLTTDAVSFINDFTGGIIINPGSRVVNTEYRMRGTPYGSGPIVIRSDGQHICLLDVGYQTIEKIVVDGNSTATYPAVDLKYLPTTFKDFELNGDFYITTSQPNSKTKYVSNTGFTCTKPIVTAYDIGFSSHVCNYFNGKITCKELIGFYTKGSVENAVNGVVGGVYLKAVGNDIQLIRLDSQFVICSVGDAIAGAALRFEGQHECCSPSGLKEPAYWRDTGYVNLNGGTAGAYTQTFKWIESDAREREKIYGYKMTNSSSSAATLILKGEANKTADACVALTGKLNLEFAADAPSSYKQIFRNRESTMTGPITVRGGELEIAGDATFANVPTVTVSNGGKLTVSATNPSLTGVTEVSLAGGCTLAISGTNPFNAEVDLYVTAGTTVDLATDVTVKRLFVDGEQFPQGTIENTYYFDKRGTGKLTVTEGPAAVPTHEVFIPAGAVQTNVTGLTEGVKLVKFGEGTLVLTEPNDNMGGAEIRMGVVEVIDSGAFGSGDVTVYGSQTYDSQLTFNLSSANFPNALVIKGNSTTNHPAVRFETATTLSGTVDAEGNFYFATGFENDPSFATESKVIFNGQVTVAAGGRIAAAPHCQVQFRAGLVTPILEGFWLPGAAANGGNAGRFVASKKVDECDYDIGRIIIDQTSFYCGNSSVADGAIIEWTGEHPADGYGYFDIAGTVQLPDGVYTGEKCATATEGLQFINSATTKTLKLNNKAGGSANWYFELGERIDLAFGATQFGVKPTFKHRRHKMTGNLPHSSTYNVGEGASFPFITTSGGSSGATVNIDSSEPDVLTSLASATHGSSRLNLNTAAAVKSVSRGHKVRITSNRTTKIDNKDVSTGDPGYQYGTLVPAGMVLDVASAKVHPVTSVHELEELACGEYAGNGVYCEFCGGGLFRVWTARTAWTNVTWSGEADADLGDAANWTNTDDGGASAATFGLPLNKATIGSGSSAAANGLVNFGKLTFAQEGDFTVNGSGIVAFYDEGLKTENGSGRIITFNVPVDFQTDKLTIAAGDTVRFAAGLTNEVWQTPAATLAINSTDNEGTLELGGNIPTNIVFKSGIIKFAANAVLPPEDTLTLDLGADAKIYVPAGQTLRVKSAKVGGNVLPVDYYSSFVTGGGNVRVAESTAPAVPTDLTWVAEGDEGALSVASNWENSPGFEFSWADKYRLIFAKQGTTGTGAVVDGPIAPRAIVFDAADGFTLKKGAADASITLGTETISSTWGTVRHDYAIEAPLVLTKATTLSFATNNSLSVQDISGAYALTFAGNSEMNAFVTRDGQKVSAGAEFYLKGTNTFAGNLTSQDAIFHLSGQLGQPGDNSTATLHVSRGSTTGPKIQYGTIHFDGVDCYKAVSIGSIGMGTVVLNAGYNTIFARDTTNRFEDVFTYSSSFSMRFEGNTKTVFENGVTAGNTCTFNDGESTHLNAEIVFNGPLNCSNSTKGDCTLGGNGLYARYIFNATGGRIGRSFNVGNRGKVVECNADYVLTLNPGWYMILGTAAAGATPTVAETGTLRLNGVKFAVPRMRFTDGAVVEGTAPGSQFEVTEETDGGSSYYCKGKFIGCVDLVIKATNTVVLSNSKVENTSTGDVIVESGKLKFASTSSWLYGTNFVVRDEGALEFTRAGQVGRQAVLRFEDSGTVYIPSDVTLRIAALEVVSGGQVTRYEDGLFDGTTGPLAGKVLGGGRIRVGNVGMMFIVK